MYRKIVDYICQSMVINRLYNRMENMVISMCLNIVITILMTIKLPIKNSASDLVRGAILFFNFYANIL